VRPGRTVGLSLDTAPVLPTDHARTKRVRSFHELATAPFTDGVNALCWERTLPGDFGEVVAQLKAGEGIITLDEARLSALPVGAAGRAAIDFMLEDLRLLTALGRDPVLNCIHGYPRDEEPGPVPTDVFSWHTDSVQFEADASPEAMAKGDTWLCTYFGPPSEGLPNDQALRKVDDSAIRAELLKQYGGVDDPAFAEWLTEHHYDLHYAPLPGAQPYSFGVGHLWRVACENTGNRASDQPSAFSYQPSALRSQITKSLPCIHRAPATQPGDPPRLLLIS